jgi:hypothetical protein
MQTMFDETGLVMLQRNVVSKTTAEIFLERA